MKTLTSKNGWLVGDKARVAPGSGLCAGYRVKILTIWEDGTCRCQTSVGLLTVPLADLRKLEE